MPVDFSQVTEIPGDKASGEQLQRLFSRYHFAKQYCESKDVLELACGSGQGLGYIARSASSIGRQAALLVEISLRIWYKLRSGTIEVEFPFCVWMLIDCRLKNIASMWLFSLRQFIT
jgi:hypothetical protein